MQDSKLCDIAVELLNETEKAWLVTDGDGKVWIPKSIGEMKKEGEALGKAYILTAPEWILKDKGLL